MASNFPKFVIRTIRMNRAVKPLFRWLSVWVAVALLAIGAAAPVDARERPYDRQLFRLAETLGAVHYLRELCVGEDGPTWRAHMTALLSSEGTSARRRALLARRFNQGYQNYSRTYRTCTVTAKAALERFLRDAAETTDAMLKTAGGKAKQKPEATQ